MKVHCIKFRGSGTTLTKDKVCELYESNKYQILSYVRAGSTGLVDAGFYSDGRVKVRFRENPWVSEPEYFFSIGCNRFKSYARLDLIFKMCMDNFKE